MQRLTIDIGAQIEHQGALAFLIRQIGGDGRALDVEQSLEQIAGERHQRARIASGHAGLGAAIPNQFDGSPHRRIAFAAQRDLHRVVRGHHLACCDEFGAGVIFQPE